MRRRSALPGQKFVKVTITLPKDLRDRLLAEVPSSETGTLSGLICSKLKTRQADLAPSNGIIVLGSLKQGASFADVLKQLQALDATLQITRITGDLNLSDSDKGWVEAIITPNQP